MKKTLTLILSMIFVVSCFPALSFAAAAENTTTETEILFKEDFNQPSTAVTITNNTFSYIARPDDLQDPSSETAYGALMSDKTQLSKFKIDFGKTYNENVTYEMDFRVEGNISPNANEIKLVKFTRGNVALSLITLDNSDANGYKVRVCSRNADGSQKYYSKGLSDGKLQYKKWYKLIVNINPANNTYDIYVNNTLIVEDVLPYYNSFSSGVNRVEIFSDKAKDHAFLVDNVLLKRTLKITSNVYSVHEDYVFVENKNLLAADFLSNITIPSETEAVLYSDYTNKVVNTDIVCAGDILEISSKLNSENKKIYEIRDFMVTDTYYVSPNGSNSNNGTSAQTAFATLDYAVKIVRMAKKVNPDSAYTVKIMAGDYYVDKKIEFTAEDSGSAQYPITYEAYGDGVVNFKGSITLDSSKATKVTNKEILDDIISTTAKDKLLQIDLKKEGIEVPKMPAIYGFGHAGYHPVRVYINGKALTEARFPNAGDVYIPISKVNNKDTYKADGGHDINYADADAPYSRTSLWDLEKRDLYIAGTISHQYCGNHIRVKEFDPQNKHLITEGSSGGSAYASRSYFYFTNILEEIDVPGESYIDEENGIIYFYPFEDMQDATIEIGVRDEEMISMSDADYITFKNLNFNYTKYRFLEAENADYLTINGCEFAHNAASALVLNGTNITVKNSHIYDLGGERGMGAIHMTGNGNRKDLIPDNNKITNNRIHDMDVIYNVSQAPAIYLLDSVGSEISNNEIYNGTAYVIRVTDANDILIKHNEIHHAVTMSSDAGAVTWGRDVTLLGFKVIENYFHDIGNDIGTREQARTGVTCTRTGQQALFHDDGSSGPYAYGNIFYQNIPNGNRNTYYSIKANGGQYGVWENNIFIGGESAANFTTWSIKNGIQDRWWLRNYNVEENPRDSDADGNNNGTAIYWYRLNNSNINFFENELWKEKYGAQYGAYWTLFTPEQKEYLETLYEEGKAASDNNALLNAAYEQRDLLTKTNIMKNNVLIDTTKPVVWNASANYHEEDYGSVVYTTQEASEFFKNYGEDFTLTSEGLAQIQKTIPVFESIDFSAIGYKQPADIISISGATAEGQTVSFNLTNKDDVIKTGYLVATAYADEKPIEFIFEKISIAENAEVPKQVIFKKAFDAIHLVVLKSLFSMKLISESINL